MIRHLPEQLSLSDAELGRWWCSLQVQLVLATLEVLLLAGHKKHSPFPCDPLNLPMAHAIKTIRLNMNIRLYC